MSAVSVEKSYSKNDARFVREEVQEAEGTFQTHITSFLEKVHPKNLRDRNERVKHHTSLVGGELDGVLGTNGENKGVIYGETKGGAYIGVLSETSGKIFRMHRGKPMLTVFNGNEIRRVLPNDQSLEGRLSLVREGISLIDRVENIVNRPDPRKK
jgi:hypothetical protein